MQKTIKQWLETLPEPYRTQALANWEESDWSTKKSMRDTLDDALLKAFDWEQTPEGLAYWDEIHEGKYPIILTPLPPTCAIEALMTIALKKGFDVQDIESIVFQRGYEGQHIWKYRLKDTDYFEIILKPDAT